mmetsp:Transcript_40828/g.50303  ORF Transcript_40828/g.50303 Transcript_40828/m.50303 type:complete len:319 (-) Transcript_40828:139-1095(-)
MSLLTPQACNELFSLEIATFVVDTLVFIAALYITLVTSYKLYALKSETISPSIFRITIIFLTLVTLSMSVNTARVVWIFIAWDDCLFLYEAHTVWLLSAWIANAAYSLQYPALLVLLYIRLRTVFDKTIHALSQFWKWFYIISIVIITAAAVGTVTIFVEIFVALVLGAAVIICSSIVIIIIFIQFVVKLKKILQVGDTKDKLNHVIVKNAVLTLVVVIGCTLALISIILYTVWPERYFIQWSNIFGSISTINMLCNTLFVHLSLQFNHKTYKLLCIKCHNSCFRCFGSDRMTRMLSLEMQCQKSDTQTRRTITTQIE